VLSRRGHHQTHPVGAYVGAASVHVTALHAARASSVRNDRTLGKSRQGHQGVRPPGKWTTRREAAMHRPVDLTIGHQTAPMPAPARQQQ